MKEISRGLEIQMRVLAAVLFREFKARMGRNYSGAVVEFGRMALMIAIFSVVRYYTGRSIHRGMEIVPFIATGVVSFWVFRRTLFFVSMSAMTVNRYAFFPQVTPLDIALARGIINIILYMILGFAAFGAFVAVGISPPIYRPAYVALLMLLSGILGLFAGIALNGLFARFKILRVGIQVAMRVLMLTSGVFFVIPEIPASVHDYALWNPLLHLNDLMRQEYFGIYHADRASFAYICKWLIGLVLLGLIVDRASRRTVAAT